MKNQNAPRPSEHPPVMGKNMSKRLGGIKGCKYKTSSWHLNRFPDADNIGSTVYNVGEKPTVVVVVVFFTLTDRASTIPSNTRGCQSGTWSAGQKKIRGTSTKLQ